MNLEEELQTTEVELQTAEQEDNYNSEVVVADDQGTKGDEEEIQQILEQVTHNTVCSCGF